MDRASVPSVSCISRILRSFGEKKDEEEKEAQEQSDANSNQNSSSPGQEAEECPIKEGKSIFGIQEPLWNFKSEIAYVVNQLSGLSAIQIILLPKEHLEAPPDCKLSSVEEQVYGNSPQLGEFSHGRGESKSF